MPYPRDAYCREGGGRLVYCQKGQRGYLAACALKGHGFENVVNLRGGFVQARLQGF